MEQIYRVIGKKIGCFKNQSGETVNYGKLFVTYLDEGTEGLSCEAFSVSPELLSTFPINEDVYLLFNKYGKVAGYLPAAGK